MTKRMPEANAEKSVAKVTPRERTAIDRFFARGAANSAPRLKVTKEKDIEIGPQHRDTTIGQILLMDALATCDVDFYQGLINQLASFGSPDDQTYEQRLNFMLSVVKGIQPRDQLESMLAAQMAAVHMLSMGFAKRFALVESLQQQDSLERAFNKLTRTFTTQMEALKRYRSGAEQKVKEHQGSVREGPAGKGSAAEGSPGTLGRVDAASQAAAKNTTAPGSAEETATSPVGRPEHAPIPFPRASRR